MINYEQIANNIGAIMDDIDRKLIDLLILDARQSSEVLGEKLMISSATVRRRINRLIDQNIIRIAAIVDPIRSGYPLRVFIALSVKPESLDSVSSQLDSHSEIVFLAATSGRFDMIAIAWFLSSDKLYEFIQNVIGKLDGIKNTETFICFQVKKSVIVNK
jgi:Lrp/AsnC family transcriptional regulator for asnA, asnC and gidA